MSGTDTPELSFCLLQAGTAVPPKEEVACPQGWHVTDDWRVEVTGAVDEAGEQCPHVGVLGWGVAEVTTTTWVMQDGSMG